MLELSDVSLEAVAGGEAKVLLHEISLRLPQGHFMAVVGPSGSGKSLLLKTIAGVRQQTGGSIRWEGRDLVEERDLDPHEVGYVPQFGIAYPLLTVRESIACACELRVGGMGRAERAEVVEWLAGEVGLLEILDRRVGVLSGGQLRRLSLALEMVSAPRLLLADEVTSGLDPKSEGEVVKLLKQLAGDGKRIVVSVTHSLRHLSLYDSVAVLHEGRLVYHGPPGDLLHYLSISDAEELYPRLGNRTSEDWDRSWRKHRGPYYDVLLPGEAPRRAEEPVEPAEGRPLTYDQLKEVLARAREREGGGGEGEGPAEPEARAATAPGAAKQFWVLFRRRWTIFSRDRGQLFLQLALLFGFPFLVVVFAWDGLPQMQNLSVAREGNLVEQLVETAKFVLQSSRVGGLVSGLVMFQVVLLALMGSNNAAREVAGERAIFEKEKFGGVRPGAYVSAKAAFVGCLVVAQGVWMGLFVSAVCGFPGDLAGQLGFLCLVNGAMASVCLAISAWWRSAEQASLVAVYLVGFQLPLSGAVLALPEVLAWGTRPFIAAYWGWSGYLQTMRDTRFYDAVVEVAQSGIARTPLSSGALCAWVLLSHIVIGLFVAWLGCRRSRWD